MIVHINVHTVSNSDDGELVMACNYLKWTFSSSSAKISQPDYVIEQWRDLSELQERHKKVIIVWGCCMHLLAFLCYTRYSQAVC